MARLRVPSANQSTVATSTTETRTPRARKSPQKTTHEVQSIPTQKNEDLPPAPKTSRRELRYMDTSFQDSENTPFKLKAPSPVKALGSRKQRVLGQIESNSRLLRKLSDESLASPEKKDRKERRVRSGTEDMDVVKKQRLMYAKSLAKSVARKRVNKGRIDVIGEPEARREEQETAMRVNEGDLDMDVVEEAETSLWCGDEQDVALEQGQAQDQDQEEVQERTESEEEGNEDDNEDDDEDDDGPVVFVRQRQRRVQSRIVQSDTEDEEGENQPEEAERRTHLSPPESMGKKAIKEPAKEESQPLISMRPPFRKGHSTISNWAQEVVDLTDSPEPPASFILPPPIRARTASFAASSRPTSSDSNAPLAVLTYSPTPTKHRSPCKAPPIMRPVTPPSPLVNPSKLISPSKRKPSIPKASDLRPSLDAFWNAEVVNDWNDRHSPSKPRVSPKKQKWREDIVRMMEGVNLEDSSSGEDIKPPSPTTSPKKKPASKRTTSPTKTPASEPTTKELRAQRKDFAARKHALAASFLTTLDTTIASGQIATLSAPTGGIKLVWSKTLKTTAGRANWRREQLRIRTGPLLSDFRLEILHHCSIELAEKVIDDETRLYNVLAHEFCHLATFMISNVRNNPHGAEFKSWGRKASAAFQHLSVEVTTKHSYHIDYKYIWECISCGYEFKRHSKSVDPERHSCGRCKGRLAQTKPTPRGGGGGAAGTAGKREMGEYQVFVKQNFARVKSELEIQGMDTQMGRVMEAVAREYREMKRGKEEKEGGEKKEEDAGLEEALGGLTI